MRTNARSRPTLAAALLLAASAAAVSGCAKSSAQPPPSTACSTRAASTVTVFVEYDGTVATTRTKNSYLCEGKDSIEWVSCDGDISDNISWTHGKPFTHDPKYQPHNKRKVLTSEAPMAGTAGKDFAYTLNFVPASGTPIPITDPRIVVMP
jgi:hypothetical protein